MAWRHNLLITRAGAVTQDQDTGAVLADPAVTTVYEGKGTLLHDTKTHQRDADRDPRFVSTGVVYLKSRKLVGAVREGDVVQAYDLKLRVDLTARVETIDPLVGSFKVSDIRVVETVASGYGYNYGNDYGGA